MGRRCGASAQGARTGHNKTPEGDWGAEVSGALHQAAFRSFASQGDSQTRRSELPGTTKPQPGETGGEMA
jgi:hypothetical protein